MVHELSHMEVDGGTSSKSTDYRLLLSNTLQSR